MNKLKQFFSPLGRFSSNEWILKQKILALLIISFSFSMFLFLFAFYRLSEGNIEAGASQLFFAVFLLIGFFQIKKNKNYYKYFSLIFFLFFFFYLNIIFFYVPQNTLNILWIVCAPVFIFYFLDKKGGFLIFLLLLIFVLYLIYSNYSYTFAEFFTLFAVLFSCTFILYSYEKIKDQEKQHLLDYSKTLENEIKIHTKDLRDLNKYLERRVEEELQKRVLQEKILLQKTRMASMGEMIDSIAHQWRQPLMNINSILMNVNRVIELKEENKEPYIINKVEDISSLTSFMSNTIEDFRLLFNENKEKDFFYLANAMSQAMNVLASSIKDINIIIDNKTEVLYYGYLNELVQVLIIIINNAKEALIDKNIKDKNIKIFIYEKDQFIYIEIEDNAQGIKEDFLDSIFEPYITSKKDSGGSGLGLYIAKIIIEQNMKGLLSAHNINDGAKFIICLGKNDVRNT